jgi:monoamine oxidase
MQRRRFLTQTSLAAAAFLAPRQPVFGIGSQPTVVVIGAGLAGLAAALRCTQRGMRVTVLEVRKRVGGRVYSFTTDTPERFVIELGAEWIGDSHERILALCDAFRLPLHNNRMETSVQFGGSFYNPQALAAKKSAAWAAKWQNLKAEYAAVPPDARNSRYDDMDWWRFLKINGMPDFDLDLAELAGSTDFGESIRHVSAAAALSEYAAPDLVSTHNEMDKKIVGGNGLLAKKMADAIGWQHIHLGDGVARVHQAEAGGCTVTTQAGRVYKADKLVCAVPSFGVQKIDWQPALPPATTAALHALQYARINKHPVQFSKKFWGKNDHFDFLTDLPGHYFYHATIGQSKTKGVVTSYTIGDKAAVFGANGQNNTFTNSLIVNALAKGFGNVLPFIEKQWNYYWGADPYSFGAYALFRPGQWNGVQQALSAPFLHTHFAGEHLADWQGFMEGAINSGEAAADALQ